MNLLGPDPRKRNLTNIIDRPLPDRKTKSEVQHLAALTRPRSHSARWLSSSQSLFNTRIDDPLVLRILNDASKMWDLRYRTLDVFKDLSASFHAIPLILHIPPYLTRICHCSFFLPLALVYRPAIVYLHRSLSSPFYSLLSLLSILFFLHLLDRSV